MTNYNFSNLSPFEFELLSRDLLQDNLNITLETFKEGKDKGIDFRAFTDNYLIVQCKKYQKYSDLYSNLKKEVSKVKLLKPKRYILITSASLSVDQKQKVFNLFTPFILSQSDIITGSDLNNLLNKYPHIERNHYKLWLSSSNILQTLLNNKIVNQSKFVLEEAKDKLKYFVENESYKECLDLLKKYNYVIISGIPGIGKSTLSEMLVLYFLKTGIKEFISISESINEAFNIYNEDESQVFLFDDFLGRNFLETSINRNEEKLIINFIRKINKSKNKFLIFTTREYILNQAAEKFDLIDDSSFSKCILDLSKYNKKIKAKILYNHLYFSPLPQDVISCLVKNKVLHKIVQHKNYNPRIIEAITKPKENKKITSENFEKVAIETLDYPFKIWEHAFEAQISNNSQILLYSMILFNSERIKFDDLFLQYKKLYSVFNSTEPSLNQSISKPLKELEGTFVKTSNGPKGITISFQNPSIQDFIIGYIERNTFEKTIIVKGALFLNELYRIFSPKLSAFSLGYKLQINEEIEKVINSKIRDNFNELKYNCNSKNDSKNDSKNEILKIHLILTSWGLIIEEKIKNDLIEKLNHILSKEEKLSPFLIQEIADLKIQLGDEMQMSHKKVLTFILENTEFVDELNILSEYSESFEDEYEIWVNENFDEYNWCLESIAENISSKDDFEDEDGFQSAIQSLEEMEFLAGFDSTEYIKEVEKNLERFLIEKEKDDNYYRWLDEKDYNYSQNNSKKTNFNSVADSITKPTEEKEIDDMFNSLLNR